MEPLKEMFNKKFFEHFAAEISKVDRSFKAKDFIEDALMKLDDLSLNQRMRNTSKLLKKYLSGDYTKNIDILRKVITRTKAGYTNLVFPDFVSQFGLADFETSLDALRYFTQFGSSEFAIREFLKVDFDSTIETMYQWSNDSNYHVRRLASEGSRPRLPWSFKLDEVIRNPAVTKPILETLKCDSEVYVRKSVANHLNDISKENPDYMINLVRTWDQSNPHTAWIIKHANRTLIKRGNKESLSVFGYEKNPKIQLLNLTLNKKRIKLGKTLEFKFELRSEKSTSQKLVVDYIVHYRKKSGELLPKVFKLKDVNLKPNESLLFLKTQTFKDFTTRKHFGGKHLLEIQVNGKKFGKMEFDIVI